jgi:transposase
MGSDFVRAKAFRAEKKSLVLRARVHWLFREAGWSKRAIARAVGVSRAFVDRWTSAPIEQLAADGRGWPDGAPRRWDEPVLLRIRQLHQRLTADPRAFFTGATAVQQAYRRRYPRAPAPSLRTIGRMLRQLGLSAPRRRGRTPGAAAYLGYPKQTLAGLGSRLIELDFIGPKYLTGTAVPLTFVGFSCATVPRLRYFYRVPSPTTTALLDVCRDFLTRVEHPPVLKVDNAPVTIGSGSAPRTLSRFVRWLLAEEIEPVFAVPRRPFSQASIEGNNSVFARKFWQPRTFHSPREVDRQLLWFNRASLTYTAYTTPPRTRSGFIPQVHFVRQVQECASGRAVGINVLNTFVLLPRAYTQLFVLATWHLATEQLHICLEREGRTAPLTTIPFPMNPNSRYP